MGRLTRPDRYPPAIPIVFKLATADLGDGIFSVSVAGEVDLATAPELKEALGHAVSSGATGVLVDLSNATFIDSTTLGVLMERSGGCGPPAASS